VAWQAFLVLAVAGLVYWPLLGSSGFAFSEGQRVLPGWQMVHSGDWLVPRLFEQPYLRKPPGMPWAIALASLVFGENEFSARSVSALAMTLASLLSFAFATRWFGRPWGLAAGLAHALTPLFFFSPTSPVGRSAEIEALHNLFAQASMLISIELLIGRPKRGIGWALALAASTAGMALVKGPAGFPCLGGAILAAAFAAKSVRPLRSPWLWTGLLAAGAVIALLAWQIHERVLKLETPPVTQTTARFLWASGEAPGVLTLALSTLFSALPTSLSLPAAWRRGDDCDDTFARALGWTCVLSLLIYTVAGISNNRYAMPALGVLPCLWAPTLKRHFQNPAPGLRTFFINRAGLGAALLLIAAIGSTIYTEHRRATRTSGQPAGEALAAVLENGALLWGDTLPDNRPEVLYYAQRRAAQLGKHFQVLWTPANHAGRGPCPLPPPGGYIALVEGDELERYQKAGLIDGLREVFSGQAHKFVFHVYRNPG
jgi:4-amino-4-deoxy-L-arabinose transferase-like glycosyltransferase